MNSCSSILNSSRWRHALADDAVEITSYLNTFSVSPLFHCTSTILFHCNFITVPVLLSCSSTTLQFNWTTVAVLHCCSNVPLQFRCCRTALPQLFHSIELLFHCSTTVSVLLHTSSIMVGTLPLFNNYLHYCLHFTQQVALVFINTSKLVVLNLLKKSDTSIVQLYLFIYLVILQFNKSWGLNWSTILAWTGLGLVLFWQGLVFVWSYTGLDWS